MFTIRFGCKECGRTVTVQASEPLVCKLCGHDNTPATSSPSPGGRFGTSAVRDATEYSSPVE